MDFDQCLRWNGCRVWLRLPAATSTPQYGEIMHVFFPTETGADIDLAIQLHDGTVHTVRASDKGSLWDMLIEGCADVRN
jgi:hypothetical protein